jgi:hypothetical protein
MQVVTRHVQLTSTHLRNLSAYPRILTLHDLTMVVVSTLMSNSAQWHKACLLRFSSMKVERAKKTHDMTDPSSPAKQVHTRDSSQAENVEPICFFCDKPAEHLTHLHQVTTMDVDFRVRKCAHELQDTRLLTKLALVQDMIALEANYHSKCLISLYNKASRYTTNIDDDGPDSQRHGIAELVAYLEDCRNDEDVAPVFKLADLVELYKVRLKQLGDVQIRCHSTRLKSRLLLAFPDLTAVSHGKDKGILLTFDRDFGDAIRKACDYDNDAMYLAKAAKVVRQDIFDKDLSFNGSFQKGCQENSIPTSLLALVNMVLKGPNIKDQTQLRTSPCTNAALCISQLLVFISVKKHALHNQTGP